MYTYSSNLEWYIIVYRSFPLNEGNTRSLSLRNRIPQIQLRPARYSSEFLLPQADSLLSESLRLL